MDYDDLCWKIEILTRRKLTLIPAAVFATFACSRGVFYAKHISSSRAHSNKIPTASPMFSG